MTTPRAARPTPLTPPTIITDARQLETLVAAWRKLPLIAIDTESNSMYAYQERTCLIQVSTREPQTKSKKSQGKITDYLIDPLEIDDLSILGTLFADPGIEKIFHAAEYDVMCLKRDYGFNFVNLFDTMIAARALGYKQLGLAALLETYFGVRPDKRFQRANWGARPLPPDQVQYAQQDTHYLPELRDLLHVELLEAKRLREAGELFETVSNSRAANPVTFDPDGFWRFQETRQMDGQELAVLRELYILRDEIAHKRDTPPFKVASDEALVYLSGLRPRFPEEIYDARGISRTVADRYVDDILAAVRRGEASRPPKRPTPPGRHSDQAMELFDRLQKWRKELASARGVETDIILTKEMLWHLADHPPQTIEEVATRAHFGPWKQEQYAQAILDVIRSGIPHAAVTSSDPTDSL